MDSRDIDSVKDEMRRAHELSEAIIAKARDYFEWQESERENALRDVSSSREELARAKMAEKGLPRDEASEEYKKAVSRIANARARAAAAGEYWENSDFDVEYERAVIRQIAMLVREDTYQDIRKIQNSYDGGDDQELRELRGLASNLEDRIQKSAYRITKAFPSSDPRSNIKPDEARKAKVEALEIISMIRQQIS